MKILFISPADCDGYCVALKLAQEGNKVWFYNANPAYKYVGRGIDNPLRVPSWTEYRNKADMIIFDMTKMGKTADSLAKAGHVVLGGSEFGDKVELDRDFGQKLMKDNTSLNIPDYKKFTNIEQGIKYLEGKEDPYVFKSLKNKYMTFVGKDDNQGVIEYMRRIKDRSLDFILQQKVTGIEVSSEGWFSGKEFMTPFNHTIEEKYFMNDNHGEQVGCQGSVVWTTEEDGIVKAGLKPLEKILAKTGYKGPFDINLIVDEDKAWFLEICMRFGYAGVQNFWELLEGDRTTFFYQFAKGNVDRWAFKEGYAMAVVLSMPPYPSSDEKGLSKIRGMKVIEPDYKNYKQVWYQDVTFDENYQPVIAGTDGIVAYITGYGSTIKEAVKRTYQTIDDITLTTIMQYRTDIGKGYEGRIDKLKKWGWL